MAFDSMRTSFVVAAGLSCLLVVVAAHASDKTVGLAKCGGTPPANVQRLASFIDIQVPSRYWVDVTWRGGQWHPADPLPMPHHHATRLELTNEAAFPALTKHREGRVRLTIDVSSRETHKVPNRNDWRTTYTATIVQACVPSTRRPRPS